MSFGFAVGDFVAAAKLTKDIVDLLRTAARAEYQELILELHELRHALNHIEHIRAPPERQSSVIGIQVAALTCTYVLDEFAKKLRKFENLSARQGASRARLWTQKLRWGFTMRDEVQRLRTYLLVHVGSLNMRLATEGLSSTYFAAQSIQYAERAISEDLNGSRRLIENIQSNIEITLRTITRQLIPQLNALIDFMNKIWQSNMKIIRLLTMILEMPTPALQHTWAQTPVKFEDALGRILPIPSEYDWITLEAIISARFASSPGRDKVEAGEYELFDSSGFRKISKNTLPTLRPGMSITMAFIVGKYCHDFNVDDRCPRPGCFSREFHSLSGGWKQCIKCALCFDKACTPLPQPRRASLLALQSSKEISFPGGTLIRQRGEVNHGSCGRQVHEHAHNERLYFKNIRLVYTPLPQTPQVRDIRHAGSLEGISIHYLLVLCNLRHWQHPLYRVCRIRGRYGCVVRVNNRKFTTDIEYETEWLAQDAAAAQAYMICSGFGGNNGMTTGTQFHQGTFPQRLRNCVWRRFSEKGIPALPTCVC